MINGYEQSEHEKGKKKKKWAPFAKKKEPLAAT